MKSQVYHGDCNDLLHKIPEADVLITDIPYNISQQSAGLRRLDYGDWDHQENSEIFKRLFRSIFKIKNACYIFCHESQFSTIYNHLKSKEWLVRSLIWIKPNPTIINSDKIYVPTQELIVYGKKRGGIFHHKYKKSCFYYPSPKERVHPTQKPVPLIEEFILDSTNIGDLVIDPFCGSGSTGVAALKRGCKFIGFEIEKKYVEIANERLENTKSLRRSFRVKTTDVGEGF